MVARGDQGRGWVVRDGLGAGRWQLGQGLPRGVPGKVGNPWKILACCFGQLEMSLLYPRLVIHAKRCEKSKRATCFAFLAALRSISKRSKAAMLHGTVGKHSEAIILVALMQEIISEQND